jgi:hypothetical protein
LLASSARVIPLRLKITLTFSPAVNGIKPPKDIIHYKIIIVKKKKKISFFSEFSLDMFT